MKLKTFTTKAPLTFNTNYFKTSIFVLIFLNSILLSAQNYFWESLNNFPGSGRGSLQSFSINGKGYWAGGADQIGSLDDLWEYDPTTDSWTEKATMPVPKNGGVSFVINNIGYILLGNSGAEMYAYNPINDTWSPKASFPGPNRYECVRFTIGNKAYVGLGNINNDFYSDFYEYDSQLDIWTQKAAFPSGTRAYMASFALGEKGYMGMGFTNEGNQIITDFWEYNPNLDSWSQKNDPPFIGKVASCSFTIGNVGYVVGGETYGPNQNYADTWAYNPVNDSWSQQLDYMGNGVHFATGFVIDNVAFVGGGGYGYRNDFYKFTDSSITSLEPGFINPIKIYPNPANTNISIDFGAINAINNYKVKIINSVGQIVYEKLINQQITSVDLSNFKGNGIYNVQLVDTQNNTIENSKIVIQ